MKKITVQKERGKCFICGCTGAIEEHHVFFGTADRKKSDEYGCVVDLCHFHHTESKDSVHMNSKVGDTLKQYAQACFEEQLGHDKFMEVFGKNYLDDTYKDNYFYKREVEAKFFKEDLNLMPEYPSAVETFDQFRCGTLGETTCPICGKIFHVLSPEWAYRENGGSHRLVCSYHCSKVEVKRKRYGKRPYKNQMEKAKKDIKELNS